MFHTHKKEKHNPEAKNGKCLNKNPATAQNTKSQQLYFFSFTATVS